MIVSARQAFGMEQLEKIMTEQTKRHEDKGLTSQEQAGTGAPDASDQPAAPENPETVHIEDEGEPLGANFA